MCCSTQELMHTRVHGAVPDSPRCLVEVIGGKDGPQVRRHCQRSMSTPPPPPPHTPAVHPALPLALARKAPPSFCSIFGSLPPCLPTRPHLL